MLRRLPAELIARVRAYAADLQIGTPEAAARLLAIGLDALASVSRGGHARREALTPDQRQAMARHAAKTRWSRDTRQDT
jgi:hypothetical protein